MKTLLGLSLLTALLSSTAGCIFVPRHPGFHSAVGAPTCPPAHYWDGYACRHNGHGDRDGDGHGHGRRR